MTPELERAAMDEDGGVHAGYLHHTDQALKEAADRVAAVVEARLAGRSAGVTDLAQARVERAEEMVQRA